MLKLNIEISAEEMNSQGFRAVREIKVVERFPANTWMYLDNDGHEIYFVVENGRNRVKPIRYFNIATGETRGYEEGKKC